MKYINKTAAILIMATTLSACGGGDGGGNDGGSSKNVDTNNYVAGDFKTLSQENNGSIVYFENLAYEFQCDIGAPDRYFESADVVVLADSYIGDDDFKYAATIVQNNLPVALSSMGYTKQEYLNEKRAYLSNDYSNYFGQLFVGNDFFGDEFSRENTHIETARVLIDVFGSRDEAINFFNRDSLIIEDLIVKMEGYYSSKSDQEIIDDSYLIMSESGNGSFNDYTFKAKASKLVICLESSRSDFNWGEGTLKGMKIAPNSVASRGDDAQVVVHELIHHLQMTFAGQFNDFSTLERWFAEGQAVYLSGQKITSGSHSRNPTGVLNIMEEGNHYSDVGLAYEDYGQAYKYLEQTYGQDSVRAMFKGMQDDKTSDPDDLFNQLPSFENQFTGHLTDIEQFRLDYPNLSK